MTVLASLVRLYERKKAEGEVPEPGFSSEKISYAIELDADGNARLSDRRSLAGKRPAPVLMNVPAPPKDRKGKKLVPGYFWDPCPYALGVSLDDDGKLSLTADRADEKWEVFKKHGLAILQDATDAGLCAFREFLNRWEPSEFERLGEQWGFKKEALKTNIIFEFRDEEGPSQICQRAAAIALLPDEGSEQEQLCLVTGETAPIARLHSQFGGISDKQAMIVSFNKKAFDSYGKSQGENAPVSQYAEFAYSAALDSLLANKGTNELNQRLRIGDTTVVFWVDTPEVEAAGHVEMLMGSAINPPTETEERMRLRAALADVATGRPANPKLDPATTVYLLGLAPNAARLSVRFWHQGRFGNFARNMVDFWEDLHIEGHPDSPSWKGLPAAWSLLYETAIRVDGKAKADTIPPLLGGEVMRAVLLGRPLPRSLLAAVIRRIRADSEPNGRRAAICKAVINRTLKSARNPNGETFLKEEMIPVSLDTENTNPAYLLGRLFAVLERAQSIALDLKVTIKDRYFASASATPARVFPLLVKNATHHLALLKKGEKVRLGYWLEKEIGLIWMKLEADMPRAFNLEDQGRFIAGYYHQRWTPKQDDTSIAPVIEESDQ